MMIKLTTGLDETIYINVQLVRAITPMELDGCMLHFSERHRVEISENEEQVIALMARLGGADGDTI